MRTINSTRASVTLVVYVLHMMNRVNKRKRFSELANRRWRLSTGSGAALLESSSKSNVPASDSLSTGQQSISGSNTMIASGSHVPASDSLSTDQQPNSGSNTMIASGSHVPASDSLSTDQQAISGSNTMIASGSHVPASDSLSTDQQAISGSNTMIASGSHVPASDSLSTDQQAISGSNTMIASGSHVPASDSLSTDQQPISVHVLAKSSCNSNTLNAELPVSVSDGNSKRKRAKLDFDNCLMQSAHQVTNEEDCFSDSKSDLSDVDENIIDKHDTDFVLDTPDKRMSTELCVGNGAFISQKCQIQDLIDQVNNTSKCATKDCKGLLKPVNIQMIGLGGTIRIQYDCTGCVERRLNFNSSTLHVTSNQTLLSVALQVGFVAAGCSYAQYHKVLAQSFGMHAVSFDQFYATLKTMHPVVKQILDNQCERAKDEMRSKADSEFGSFRKAVTNGDGVWMTRGHHSQNFTYHMRDYFSNGILYYEHYCQRGNDSVCDGELFEGTSKAAEGHATASILKRAKDEGMNIVLHWQDDDSSASKCFTDFFPDAKIMLCSGHAARAHEKMLKKLKAKRSFAANDIDTYKEKYPDVQTVKCCCPKKHSQGCGCFTDGFIKLARSRFVRAMCDAENDPKKFVFRLTALHHHARNIHSWYEGSEVVGCDFHPMFVCTCGKCQGELTCSGKLYETSTILSCPFHSLLYEIECDKRAERACDIIHPVLGRGHTNKIESAHYTLALFRPKTWHIKRLHYQVSTNLGLLQSNLNYMNRVCGMEYHWLSELFECMQLPLLDGMEAVLKQANRIKIKQSEKRKTKSAKQSRQRSKAKHRGKEQLARQKWGKSQKISHTYGTTEYTFECTPNSSPIKSESTPTKRSRKPCSCGSIYHSRTSHRDCPLNKREGEKGIAEALNVDDSDSLHSEDEMSQTDSEDTCLSSDDVDDYQYDCGCPNRSHKRECPLNPRKKWAKLSNDLDDNSKESSHHIPLKLSECEALVSSSSSELPFSEHKLTDKVNSEVIQSKLVSASKCSKKPCKCGSVAHSRINHRDCPLNKGKGKVTAETILVGSARDSNNDESLHKDNQSICSCSGRAHHRKCPMNPRQKGAEPSNNVLDNSEEKASKASECIVVGVSNSSIQPSGPLPNLEWKQSACEMIRCWSSLPVITESEPIKPIECSELLPHVCDAIVGDGHCLFRALSKEVTGTQINHKAVRLAITNFLTNSHNAQLFGQFFFGKREDHLCTVTTYVNDSGMCQDAWGTDKEIIVAATMFQVNILTFSDFGKHKRTWLRFSPAFCNYNCTIPSVGIKLHLYHTVSRDHFDRVIPCLAL